MRDDSYGEIGYEKFIDWAARLGKEGPLLLDWLESAPGGRVLDLGCGTGHHVRFFADQGLQATGIDSSLRSIEFAREETQGENPQFVHLDLKQLSLLEEEYDAALCLGNTLPHLTRGADMRAFLEGLRKVLVPGGLFLLQMLNYEKLLDHRWHQMPARLYESKQGERVLLFRLMDFPGERVVRFSPSLLTWRPGGTPPLQTLRSEELTLRAWAPEELTEWLERSGFDRIRRFGSLSDEPYRPDSSPNLVLIGRRP